MKKVTLNLFAKLLIQPEINELNWLVSKIKGYKAKIKKILDLGSGYGEKTICLSNEFKDINFVGIDKYKSAITSSKKDSRHSTNPPNFMVGNINKLPFKDNSFDCIISIRSLHFIKNKAKKISEISRVLKKRGILLIISFFKKESFLIWLPRTIHERRFRKRWSIIVVKLKD